MIFQHAGRGWSIHTKAGRYYWVETTSERSKKTGRLKLRWHALSRVADGLGALATALDALISTPARAEGDMPKLIALYLKAKLPELRSAYVRKEYQRIYDRISTEFEVFNVADVRPTDVLDLLSLFAGRARTRMAYKSRLSSFFGWCVLGGYISTNPCAEVRVKRPPKRGAKLDAEKFHAIRAGLPEIGQCILDALYLTMQRVHDIRLLRESQIVGRHIAITPTKTEHSSGESTMIPITPELQAVLDRARAKQKVKKVGTGDAFVFQIAGGTAYSKTGWNSAWKRARTAAGLTGIASTDVRPYAMKCAQEAGYTLEQIQATAAHALVTTTAGYMAQYAESVSVVRLSLPPKPKTA